MPARSYAIVWATEDFPSQLEASITSEILNAYRETVLHFPARLFQITLEALSTLTLMPLRLELGNFGE